MCRKLPESQRKLVPINWREWHQATKYVAEKLGLSLFSVGEMKVTDVLQALHADEPEDTPACAKRCNSCGGLAIELDDHGHCRICASNRLLHE